MTNEPELTNYDKALQILIAAGVWDDIAVTLADEFSLERIKEVVEYVVYIRHYDYPGPAILKALREDWTIKAKADRERLAELLNINEDTGGTK